jgi:hypothetical protein
MVGCYGHLRWHCIQHHPSVQMVSPADPNRPRRLSNAVSLFLSGKPLYDPRYYDEQPSAANRLLTALQKTAVCLMGVHFEFFRSDTRAQS